MGEIIRPAAFARTLQSQPVLRLGCAQSRAERHDRFDVRMAAIMLAIGALIWILALTGAAFAIRAAVVVGFTTLAGRPRRFGVPVRAKSQR
jgi:hypothetical protein